MHGFTRFQSAGWRGWVRDGFGDLAEGDPLARWDALPHDEVRRRPTARTIRAEHAGSGVFVKHVTGLKDHDPRSDRLVNRIRWRFGPSRVRRTAAICRRLEAAGVGVPRVLLVASRCDRWRRDELLVTRAVPARTMYDFFIERRPRDEMIAMFATVGRGVAHLHRMGFVHGDLPPGNVLVPDDGTSIVLLDNERTKHGWFGASAGARRRNLEQMIYRMKMLCPWRDWRAFLDAYDEGCGMPASRRRRDRGRVLRRVHRRFSRWLESPQSEVWRGEVRSGRHPARLPSTK